MKNLLRKLEIKKRPGFFLVLLSVIFVFVYASVYLASGGIYNSPDETANAAFIQQFARTGTFLIPATDPNLPAIAPRSVNVVDGMYVPTGFLGLPFIYGTVEAVLDGSLLAFLTPLFAVLGVLALWGILRRIFSERVAILSAIFAFLLPQWWHFASKGLLPNVPFLSFLLIGVYFFIRSQEEVSIGRRLAFLSGASLAAALMIRPAEVWWVAGAAVFFLLLARKQLQWKRALWTLLGGLLVFAVWAPFQVQTYGGLLQTGYATGSTASNGLASVVAILFPFGLHPLLALQNAFNFIARLFWWQVILAAAGLIFWLRDPQRGKWQKRYAWALLGISLYLILLYGSWMVQDDLDINRVSIGVSYVRYWLPIYFGLLPFFVVGLEWVLARAKHVSRFVPPLLVALLLLGQAYFVYAYGDDNLSALHQNIVHYTNLRASVVAATPPGAVIVNERMDKAFWPARAVYEYQGNTYDFVGQLPAVAKRHPLYWYTILPAANVQELQQLYFTRNGFSLKQIWRDKDGALYQLEGQNK